MEAYYQKFAKLHIINFASFSLEACFHKFFAGSLEVSHQNRLQKLGKLSSEAWEALHQMHGNLLIKSLERFSSELHPEYSLPTLGKIPSGGSALAGIHLPAVAGKGQPRGHLRRSAGDTYHRPAHGYPRFGEDPAAELAARGSAQVQGRDVQRR